MHRNRRGKTARSGTDLVVALACQTAGLSSFPPAATLAPPVYHPLASSASLSLALCLPAWISPFPLFFPADLTWPCSISLSPSLSLRRLARSTTSWLLASYTGPEPRVPYAAQSRDGSVEVQRGRRDRVCDSYAKAQQEKTNQSDEREKGRKKATHTEKHGKNNSIRDR